MFVGWLSLLFSSGLSSSSPPTPRIFIHFTIGVKKQKRILGFHLAFSQFHKPGHPTNAWHFWNIYKHYSRKTLPPTSSENIAGYRFPRQALWACGFHAFKRGVCRIHWGIFQPCLSLISFIFLPSKLAPNLPLGGLKQETRCKQIEPFQIPQ